MNELKIFMIQIQKSIEDLADNFNYGLQNINQDLTSIHKQIVKTHTEINSIHRDNNSIHDEINGIKQELNFIHVILVSVLHNYTVMDKMIFNMNQQIYNLENKTHDIFLILENDTNKKISSLFDHIVDDIRYREIIRDTERKTENLDMRVSNLEASYQRI